MLVRIYQYFQNIKIINHIQTYNKRVFSKEINQV